MKKKIYCLILVLIIFHGIVLAEKVMAAPMYFIDTSDVDFNAGDHTQTQVIDTGEAALVELGEDVGIAGFSSPQSVATSFGGARNGKSLDMEGDGDIDVVAGAYDDGEVAWYENDGSYNFTEHTIDVSINGPNDVFPFDIDEDGDWDLVAAAYHDTEVIWYENDGFQVFTKHIIDNSGSNGPYKIKVNNLDENTGDIDYDIVVNYYNGETVWFENDGAENFTKHSIGFIPPECISLEVLDLDGVNGKDIVVGCDQELAWYENDGSENFIQNSINTSFGRIMDIDVVDFDGDSDFDIFITDQSGEVAWFENLGGETYGAKNSIDVSVSLPHTIHVIDLDGDSYLDVVSGEASGGINWYQNDGLGGLTKSVISSVDGTYFEVLDMNNDSNLDILASSDSGNSVYWLENIPNRLTPGVFESRVFDTVINIEFLTISWTEDQPVGTSFQVRARTSDNPAMIGAPVWSTCDVLSNGQDLSLNNCVIDTERYVQYQVVLDTSSIDLTPQLEDMRINYDVCTDSDSDGYYQEGGVCGEVDCDDFNSGVNPGASEICNGIDDDCIGGADNGLTFLNYHQDSDGDGYGNPMTIDNACSQPLGYVLNNQDCNDSNALINPSEIEICNGVDDNCSGQIDEGFSLDLYYQDSDGDGYGDPDSEVSACTNPFGYILQGGDCNDFDASIYPGAFEIINDDIDQDCDGEDSGLKIEISGRLYRSTHTQKTKKGFQKASRRKICAYTKGGTKKDCDRTTDRGVFYLENLTPGHDYYLVSSSKRPVTKEYFYERMLLYKIKYQPTFGDYWIRKFNKKYRIKKSKDKGYPYEFKYYRKYKAKEKIEAQEGGYYRVYMR